MKATFVLDGSYDAVAVRLTPESPEEATLLAAFVRYDANVASFRVERGPEREVTQLTICAGQDR